MAGVTACDVPEGSLLAAFGGPQDYRDCFCREVAGTVTLTEFIERFYCSTAFRPERIVLGLIGRGASSADVRALAHGQADAIAVWKVVERREDEILLESRGTGTASWLAVGSLHPGAEAVSARTPRTRLLFGSWVGNLEQSGWRVMQRPHQWYSRFLLGGVRGLGR
ncbi:hypothetical protein [Erythrobacter sp.]|uniref:hypothetical protein n=1 Tax=Erythrobacter sp. TaxID=1042 RepID=UPI001B21F4F6|nr:hypothetical protein [Erythrobacter sp.]MBO6527514.1 hypothetical protein [Erythrobacter sp.]MBO6530194.1 hypothetical protein [Erythrobacter sp.]